MALWRRAFSAILRTTRRQSLRLLVRSSRYLGKTTNAPSWAAIYPILAEHHPNDGGIVGHSQLREQAFRLMGLLAASIRQVVTRPAAEVFGPRGQVQLAGSPLAGHAAHDQRPATSGQVNNHHRPPNCVGVVCIQWESARLRYSASGNVA